MHMSNRATGRAMKRAVVVTLVLLLSVSGAWAGAAKPAKKSWFKRAFERPTWDEVAAQCVTPQDVCRLVERYVVYRTEDVDTWYSAKETWAAGRGDCEDFAVVIEQLCHDLGFDVSVALYFPAGGRGEGHAVAVGTWQGQLWMSSLGSYEKVDSMDEVRERVARMMECDDEEVWSSRLNHEDVQRFVARSTVGGAGTAVAGW